MPALVLTGRPGSGKGTLGSVLAEKLGIPHISTGDIFRNHMEEKTPLGLQIIDSMNAGKYTSDKITNRVVLERLQEEDCRNGYILDGYPRTLNQVLFMENTSIAVDHVIYLDVSEATCLKRLLSRGETSGRPDDQSAEVVKDRLAIYTDTMTPVLDRYRTKGKLVTVNGEQSPEEVVVQVMALLS